ncbi:MAG: hypothetical protein CO093_00165 [Alphaproteobacteria bacterium CG_4_9_14_3_um_filter_47_13]|nr:MAG: hypothetical protein CO093_00165 [Alphaproteobacteria bacterium CG_4_9_14_3_um_filter_47_13]
MVYQSKWHKFICVFFRYFSFFIVVLNLASYLAFVWFEYPDFVFQTKMFMTTACVLLASIVIQVIFTDKEPKKNKNVLEDSRKLE